MTRFETRLYINGVFRDSNDRSAFPVTNPATGDKITDVANATLDDTVAAITAAHDAFPFWSKTLAKGRAKIMRAWFELVMKEQDALAALMVQENGKPLKEAKSEVAYGASFVEWFAEESKRVYGDMIPSPKDSARIMVIKQPVGVVAAITPWNFPVSMILRKVSPAIAAGCTVVLKPAEDTPLCALFLADLAHKAGLPPGVLNIIPCDKNRAPEIGKVLSTDLRVRKISFTGSTRVGKILMKQGADTVKRISLELGGNAPFIVFDDADLEQAVAGAVASKFRNAGQTCVCANRIYVQDGIHDAFVEKLSAKIKALKVGPGMQEGVEIGPLINAAGLKKVEDHVQDALAKGAKLVQGGAKDGSGDLFYKPTLLTGMTSKMAMATEETFGPVAGIFRFKTDQEAVDLANDTRYGLASYIYTKSLSRAVRVSEALEYGMVGVNEPIISNEVAPFGGWKESGLGREGSYYGMEDYLEKKYVLLGGI